MNKILCILVLVFSTSIFFVTAVKAETYSFAKTTAGNLNVRATAGGQDVINKLPYGSVVAILQEEAAWSYVLYIENDDTANPKYGWVSSQYIQVLYSKEMEDTDDRKVAGI